MGSSGSSKKQTVGYKYYVGMHVALCHGTVDELISIDIDDKEAWVGPIESGRVTIDKPSLFGGDSREGGVSGALDFEPGGPTQGQNDYLAGLFGSANVPSFRGVSCAVLRQMYVGMNPYLKKWLFRMQRIFLKHNGVEQWYSEKAAIPLPGYGEEVFYTEEYLDPNEAAPTPEESDGTLTISVPRATTKVVLQHSPGTDSAWSPWLGYGTTTGMYPGSTDDPLWWCAISVKNAEGEVSIYWNDAYYMTQEEAAAANLDPIILTGSTSYQIWIADTLLYNRGAVYLDAYSIDGIFDMNPAHIVRECLTDPNWGIGISEDEIDDTSFTAAADTLFAENMGISILWNKTTSIDTFISEILRHVEADLSPDNSTGKIKLKLIRNDYDEEALITLNETNIVKIEDFNRVSIGELINEVIVTYWDSVNGDDKTVVVQDVAMIQAQGGVVSTTVNYPGFTHARIATLVAQRDLKSLSTARATCTIYAKRVGASLEKGDVFKLSWSKYGVTSMLMRVTSIDLGDGKNNTVKIGCTQDTFSLPDIELVSESEILWESVKVEPEAITDQIAFELPYFDLVQRYGQDFVDYKLGLASDIGFVGVGVVRPTSSAINAKVYTDSGAGYQEYGTCDFCPFALLAADVSYLDTEFALSDAIDVDLITIGTWAQIDDELVGVVAVSSTTMTVKRGVLDTLPAIHDAGAKIFFWDEYSGSDEVEYVDSDEVSAKLLPVTTSGVLDIADATAVTATMDQRAIRPYPPGNLKLNGESYNPNIGADSELVITWAHRDRTQQTTDTLVAQTDGNIGPEDGTTYTIRIYGEDDVLLRTVTGLETTTYTYAAADEYSDNGFVPNRLSDDLRVEVESVCNGITSFNMWDVTTSRNYFMSGWEGAGKITITPSLSLSADDDFTGTDGDDPYPIRWTISSGDPSIYSNKLRGVVSSTNTIDGVTGNFAIANDSDALSVSVETYRLSITNYSVLEFRLNIDADNWAAIQLIYQSGYLVRFKRSVGGTVTSNDIASKDPSSVRIDRSGSDFSAYAYYSGAWHQIGTAVTIGSGDVTPSLEVFVYNTYPSFTSDFDNFTVITGTPVWPDLTNIQLPIYLNDSSGLTAFDASEVFTELGSNSKKIALEIGDTGVECSIEIPPGGWDETNQEAMLLATIPSLTSSSSFNFYYDSTHADNTNVTDVDPLPDPPTDPYELVVYNLALVDDLWALE